MNPSYFRFACHKSLSRLCLVSIGLFALHGSQANAALFTAGDLLMGFHATGGQGADQTYVVDLGSAALLYRDATSTFTLSVTGVGTDLASVYGATWYSRSDLYWGFAAAASSAGNVPPPGPAPVNGDTTRTIYASRHEDTLGQAPAAWVISTDGAMGQSAGNIITVAQAFAAGSATANNTAGVLLPTSGVDWADYNTKNPDASFTNFVGNNGVEDTFANGVDGGGVANSRLDLFRILDYTTYNGSTNNIVAGPARTGTDEGYFTITKTGTVSFNVVPEPNSTWLAVAGGIGMLGFARAAAGLRPR